MSICGCFSPNPRLGKNNSFQEDAEPPELAFTDKQNRFSQDVLTGLRGMSAPTTAGRSHATVYFPHSTKGGQPQRAPSQNFRRVTSTAPPLDAPQMNGSLKKSDLWTQSRANLEEAIEEEKENTDHNWDSDLLTHEQRLEQRLNKLKLDMFIMGSDGACQFRSISYGLFGTEAYHKAIRRKAVHYLREHRSDFEAFLGDDFNHWLKEMSQNGTWGDELTLRAICEAYGIVINVITSDQQHWFMRYEPEGTQPKKSVEVFVTYIAPIHYNAVRRQTQTSQLRRSFSRTKSSRIQQAMDRASSQSLTEQHKRLGQQHQQAEADAAASHANANKARPARGLPLQTLTSVMEDPDETMPDTAATQNRQQAPTGTFASTTAAPIDIPAGSQRSSGSGKRLSPKPMHYGMTEHSSPLPVLHSPFASASLPAAQRPDVLESVDANLQSLQQKL
ncbi:hypothetical protein ABBQ32_14134 [Trebouxia sp. C0010 RCD-2024]